MAFDLDLGQIIHKIEGMPPKADEAVKMLAETGADKMQNYAQQNAPWTDRTAHARQRLTGSSSAIADGYRVSISHGVDYGIYLELANEKKYGIIPDTLEIVGEQEIMPAFENLLEKIT